MIFSDDYRPFVRGGDSRMESLLGQKTLLVEIVKGFWNPSSDNLRKWPENLIEVVLAQPEHFMFFGKLYYYKEKFLQDVGQLPSHEFFLVKKAIHDLPGDIFHKLSAEVRETIPMGMEKLRLTCKRLFLWVDRNSKVVPLGPESCGEGAGAPEDDEDDFVPSIKRLVDDLIPMLQPEDRHYIDRFLNTFDGKPLTSEQRKHPDWIKLAGLCFDVCVGSPEPNVISRINAGIFNRCVERQRDEFRQATDSQRHQPTYPGLPLRRQCDNCGVDKALAEWRYPYCTSCNVHWLSPRFRRMDRLNGCCPICLLPPKSAEFIYTLRCGHALHLNCLEYAKSVRAECPGEQILSVCPVCNDPITDDLEKVVFVQDVWPTHKFWWPDKPPGFIEAADNGLRAAEGAYSTASAALRDLASFATLTKIALDVWTEKNKATLNRVTADLAAEQEQAEAALGLRDLYLTQMEELSANAARAEGERAAAARRVAALDAAQDKLASAQDMVEASAAAAKAAISEKNKNAALL